MKTFLHALGVAYFSYGWLVMTVVTFLIGLTQAFKCACWCMLGALIFGLVMMYFKHHL